MHGPKAAVAEVVGASGHDFPPTVGQRCESRLGDVNAATRAENYFRERRPIVGGRYGPLARRFLAHAAEINSKEGRRRGGRTSAKAMAAHDEKGTVGHERRHQCHLFVGVRLTRARTWRGKLLARGWREAL